MVVRIKITLEQEEYSGLLRLALTEMRNPQEQLRFILVQHLKRARLLPCKLDSVQTAKQPAFLVTAKNQQENNEYRIAKT
jgi:hypothetical protein